MPSRFSLFLISSHRVWKFFAFQILIGVLFFLPNLAFGETSNEHKLAPNDLLDFRVFQEPELDAVVRISGDGQAIFPLVGGVVIGGATISEAIELIKARYRNGYLINPQLTLTVRTYAKKLFTILGQVQQPGSYDIQGGNEITLLQAVGMAGGYTKIADPGNVTVKRLEEGGERVLKFNAKRMARGDEKTSFLIKAGDVISVGESLF